MSRDIAGDSATGQVGQGFEEGAAPQTNAKALPSNKQVKFSSSAEQVPVWRNLWHRASTLSR